MYLPTTIPVSLAGFAKLQVTTPYTLVPSHKNSCWSGRFYKATGHNSIHSCTFPQQFLLAWQVLPSCRSQLHIPLYLPTTIPIGLAGFAKLQVTTPYILVPFHNNSYRPGRFCKAAGHNFIHSCTFPQQFLLAWQALQSCRSQLHTLLYLPTTIPFGLAGFSKLQVTTLYTLVPSHNNSYWPGRFCKAAGHNSIHSCTFPQQFLLAWQVLQSCRSQLHTPLYLPTTIPVGLAGFAKLQVTTPYTLVTSHNNSCWPGRFCQAAGHNSVHSCTFQQQFLSARQVLPSCRSQLHTLLYLPTTIPLVAPIAVLYYTCGNHPVWSD